MNDPTTPPAPRHKSHDEPIRTPPRQHGAHDMPMKPTPHGGKKSY